MANLGIINSSGFNALKSGEITLNFNKSLAKDLIDTNGFYFESYNPSVPGINQQTLINMRFALNPEYYNNVFYQDNNQYNWTCPCFMIYRTGKYYLLSGLKSVSHCSYTDTSDYGSYFINSLNSSFKFAFNSQVVQQLVKNTNIEFDNRILSDVFYYSPFNLNSKIENAYDLIFKYTFTDDGYKEATNFNFNLLNTSGRYKYNYYDYNSINLSTFYPGLTQTYSISPESDHNSDIVDGIYQNISGRDSLLLNYDTYKGRAPLIVYNDVFNYRNDYLFYSDEISYFYNLQFNYYNLFMYNRAPFVSDTNTGESYYPTYYNQQLGDFLYVINNINYRNIDAETNNLVLEYQQKEITNTLKNYIDNPVLSFYLQSYDDSYSVTFYGFELNSSNLSNYFVDSDYLASATYNDIYRSAFNSVFNLSIATISIGVVLTSLAILHLIMRFIKH